MHEMNDQIRGKGGDGELSRRKIKEHQLHTCTLPSINERRREKLWGRGRKVQTKIEKQGKKRKRHRPCACEMRIFSAKYACLTIPSACSPASQLATCTPHLAPPPPSPPPIKLGGMLSSSTRGPLYNNEWSEGNGRGRKREERCRGGHRITDASHTFVYNTHTNHQREPAPVARYPSTYHRSMARPGR